MTVSKSISGIEPGPTAIERTEGRRGCDGAGAHRDSRVDRMRGRSGRDRKLMGDPAEQQPVMSVAGHSTVVLQNPCPAAQYSIEKIFILISPLLSMARGKLVSGAWKQVVDEQGLRIKRVLNVLVWAQAATVCRLCRFFQAPLMPMSLCRRMQSNMPSRHWPPYPAVARRIARLDM